MFRSDFYCVLLQILFHSFHSSDHLVFGPATAFTAVIKHSAWTAVIRESLASCTVIEFVGVIRMRIESIWLSITESWSWSMSGGGGSSGGLCGCLSRFEGGGWRQRRQF